MGRPETISCERCGTTVAVKAKGPVPSYCADCRLSRTPSVRPESVDCERCGARVVVGSRGPIPRYCRDGCQNGNGRSSPDVVRLTFPVADPVPVRPRVEAPAQQPAVVAAPATGQAGFKPTTVTRLATIDPASVLGQEDLGRTARRRRLRHNAAVAAWLIIVLAVVLILFIGSRPAATDLQSYARLLV